MDLGTMLRVMLRRWYVSIPALIVSVALPAGAWSAIAAKYQTTSTISLLNSAAASSANLRTGNAFLAFDSSLTPTADFLSRRLSSDQAGQDLAARGVLDPATVEFAPNASGPFLTLTVTGKDQNKVLTELQTFDQYAIEQLAAIQTASGPLPAADLIRAVVVVPPQKPTTSKKTKFEDVAGAGVAGLAILFLSVFGTEAMALRRSRNRAGGAPERRGRAAHAGGLTQRAHPLPSTTGQLPRYSDPDLDLDLDIEDEDEAEPWIDIEPLPLKHLAITDRDPGSY
jgi:hypothetical protein